MAGMPIRATLATGWKRPTGRIIRRLSTATAPSGRAAGTAPAWPAPSGRSATTDSTSRASRRARLLPVRCSASAAAMSDVIAGLYWSVGIVPGGPGGSTPPRSNLRSARVVNLSMAAYGAAAALSGKRSTRRAHARPWWWRQPAITTATTRRRLNQPANCRSVIAVTAHTRRGDPGYANPPSRCDAERARWRTRPQIAVRVTAI